MRTIAVIIVMVFMAGVDSAQSETVTNVADQMIGRWRCTAATINGKELPETTVKNLRLTVTGTRYKTESAEEVLFDSTYQLATSEVPTQINLPGSEGELANKQALGIIWANGDTLTICYTMPGKRRPATFVSSRGSEAYLVVWKRELN